MLPRARRSITIFVLCSGAALLCAACSEGERSRPDRSDRPRPPSDEVPEEEPGYRVIELEEPGSIAGVLRWSGERPEIVDLPVRVDADACGPQASPALRVSERGGVADGVISLVDVAEGLAIEAPSTPPEIVSRSCRFEPHVLALATGTAVVFRSEDSVLHNVHGYRDGHTVWDFAQPARGAHTRRTLAEPGIIRIVCDVHAWTEGWIHVHPHPYFAVTDAEGRYRLTGIPAGQYVLRVWHEGWRVLGFSSGRPRYSSPIILTRSVSVSPREETSLDFELSQESAEAAGD